MSTPTLSFHPFVRSAPSFRPDLHTARAVAHSGGQGWPVFGPPRQRRAASLTVASTAARLVASGCLAGTHQTWRKKRAHVQLKKLAHAQRPARAQNAYITNANSGTVSVINTATNMVVGSPITVGNFPFGVAVTPDGSKVYVANQYDGTVSVIATATNMVVGSPITVGNGPVGVAVTPDGSKVYVANEGDSTVSVISTATNTVIGSPSVGSVPLAFGLFIQPAPVVFSAFTAKLT